MTKKLLLVLFGLILPLSASAQKHVIKNLFSNMQAFKSVSLDKPEEAKSIIQKYAACLFRAFPSICPKETGGLNSWQNAFLVMHFFNEIQQILMFFMQFNMPIESLGLTEQEVKDLHAALNRAEKLLEQAFKDFEAKNA